MADPGGAYALITLTDADALRDHLDALNEAGTTPVAVGIAQHGRPSPMSGVRFAVDVHPARWGYIATVPKTTTTVFDDGKTFVMHWEPEPRYWRPTEPWAIRRADRRRRKERGRADRLAATREAIR